jgi:hypothetical protein
MKKSLCILALSAVLSCGVKEEKSSLNYATFTPGRATMKEWSAFTTIERRGCVLPVQIYAIASPSDQGVTNAEFIRISIETAVSAWVDALKDNPFWKCKKVAFQYGEAGQGTIRVYIDNSLQRSYAIVGKNEVYLAGYLNESDQFSYRVILHEMGHMFGLADTYTEPGRQQPLGQPASIMNNLYMVPGLTSDDIFGANALYEYINNRSEFCSNGYSVGMAWENQYRIAFCVPTF